jgi:S-DNA-T family DNA segregation ATPase FtsK/SpoIIIE
MEKRYKLFAENDVRNLEGYNNLAEMSDDMVKMPHIVIIVDELADLMMTAPKEVEDSICRIAQKARAAGMHLIIATQRPSVDVVTGLIKANVPTRVAFAVSSQIDSRTILDVGGAEKLLGKGDMLFCPVGSNKPTRIQGCFVSDAEVERVVEFVKTGRVAEYDKSISDTIESITAAKEKGGKSEVASEGEHDAMIDKAIECVIEAGQASTSLLQRRLKLGYARAARIVDEMEVMGIVGPYEGSKPRQVLISQAQWLERQAMSGSSTEEAEQSTFDEE